MDAVDAYLAKNPFTAEQTADNEIAYEKLMDVRCKLYVRYVLIRYLFIFEYTKAEGLTSWNFSYPI